MVHLRANTKKYSINPKECRKKDKETKNKCDKQKTNRNIVDINPAVLIIALNISGLRIEIKNQIIK